MTYRVTFYRKSKAIRFRAPSGRASLGIRIVPADENGRFLWDKGMAVGFSLTELGGILRALEGRGEFSAVHRPGGGFSKEQGNNVPVKNIFMGMREDGFIISVSVENDKHTFALSPDEIEVVKHLLRRAIDAAIMERTPPPGRRFEKGR